jgi:hypothetical protein
MGQRSEAAAVLSFRPPVAARPGSRLAYNKFKGQYSGPAVVHPKGEANPRGESSWRILEASPVGRPRKQPVIGRRGRR